MAGVVPAAPGRRLDAYLRWIASEQHGQMGYMARSDRVARRQDLNVILPGVHSIVCVGLDYYTLSVPEHVANDPSRGRISNYAWGVDYHDVMTPRLQELAAWLRQQAAGDVKTKVYVDTGAILERDHAETAGLGFTGKNTMLIGPRRGSFFFLGELLTTLPLAYDTPRPAMPTCGSCRRCLDACPTNAFPEPYVLDARRCISYLTIELKGWIPHELRPLMGNWIYGCDVCQDVCPFNRFAQPILRKPQDRLHEPTFQPTNQLTNQLTTQPPSHPTTQPPNWDAVAPPLLDILALDEAGFNERFAHSPIKRIKRTRLLRNVCVAAGNWGSEAAVPALIALLQDAEPLIRGHAAWALHQIGSRQAEAALAAALAHETDELVRQEMAGAAEESKNRVVVV